MPDHPFLLPGLCFLLTREMDTVGPKERKMLPVTSGMEEEAGYRTLSLVHVPPYRVLLLGTA